jgi:hypothetical protein
MSYLSGNLKEKVVLDVASLLLAFAHLDVFTSSQEVRSKSLRGRKVDSERDDLMGFGQGCGRVELSSGASAETFQEDSNRRAGKQGNEL